MARPLSPQRRKIVAMAGAIASMAGLGPTLAYNHPYLRMTIIGFTAVGLVYVISQMVKLKRAGNCG